MPVTVKLPAALRAYVGHKGDLSITASTVGEVVSHLAGAYPELKPHLLDEAGEIRPFVSFFADGRPIKATGGLATALSEGSVVTVVPAIAGGGAVS
jgi:molybdopterin converting factor small subunit